MTGFGERLDEVSLLADRETAAASMASSYTPYVSPKLLAAWQAAPSEAPGRATSSPWPDRIEIDYLDKLTQERYMITGKIIEITSTEVENGGVAAHRPIVLSVEKTERAWRITHVVLGAYATGTMPNGREW